MWYLGYWFPEIWIEQRFETSYFKNHRDDIRVYMNHTVEFFNWNGVSYFLFTNKAKYNSMHNMFPVKRIWLFWRWKCQYPVKQSLPVRQLSVNCTFFNRSRPGSGNQLFKQGKGRPPSAASSKHSTSTRPSSSSSFGSIGESGGISGSDSGVEISPSPSKGDSQILIQYLRANIFF